MPPTVSETAVRAAIFSLHVPQCYEQLARKIESVHAMDPGSITGRLLSGKVRALMERGDVVEIVDQDMLRRLHCHPQHFGPSARFFMAWENVPDSELSNLGPRPTPPPAAGEPTPPSRTAKRPRPATQQPAQQPPADRAPCREPKDAPTATVRQLDFSVPRPLRSVPRAPIPAVAFSAGTEPAPQADAPGQRELDRATRLVATTMRDAAAAIRQQAQQALLPLNKAWTAGQAQLPADEAAELGRLYALASERAAELDKTADELDPPMEPPVRLTGTGK